MHIRLLYKKVLCVFLSLMIVISSTQSAFANTSVGGWSLVDSAMDGARASISAAKTSGGIALQSVVKVAPSVAKVGGKLIRGGGTAALLMAVPQILGDGVDWLLDPANNAIKYTIPVPEDGTGTGPYSFTIYSKNYQFSSVSSACNRFIAVYSAALVESGKPKASSMVLDSITPRGTKQFTCNWSAEGYGSGGGIVDYNSAIDPQESEDAYLPINSVAAQVISNAEAGHGPSQDVVEAVALEGFAAGELDPALNAAANAVGAEAAAPDVADPADPTAPATPIDYTSILSSIKALLVGLLGSFSDFTDWYKEQWATFTGSFTEIKDWAMAEPAALEDEPLLIGDDSESVLGWEEKANAGYVNFDGQCPADVQIPITFLGSSSIISLSYTPFCHFASLIKYAVIMGAWIGALMIISVGRARE